MGKSQIKKKTQTRRHNPIRVPDTHVGAGKGDGKADPGKQEQMLPILRKLKSAEYADRTWACAAICNLIQNDAATRRLFQGRNVVGELIERLSDSVDEVVVEASGTLRNLAIDGGHELCGEMFNKGIMSHLVVLMGKISSTIDGILAFNPAQPQTHTDAELQARKHLLALSENVISLIWCLAEASHKTLAAINAAGVEKLLIKVVQGRKVVGLGVTLAAAQALYALTLDNRPFTVSILKHPSAVDSLVDVCREDHAPVEAGAAKRAKKGKKTATQQNGDIEYEDGRALLSRLLFCGILRNIVRPDSRADENVDIRALTNEVILPLINSLLDLDLNDISQRALALANGLKQQDPVQLSATLKTDHVSPTELALERIERMLNTVTIGLEILTGICAGVQDVEDEVEAEEKEEAGEAGSDTDMVEGVDEDEDMDGVIEAKGEDEGSDDEDIQEALQHAALVNGSGHGQAETISTPVTLQHLLSIRLPERLLKLAQLTPLSFPPSGTEPSHHPPTTSALSSLHLRALEALNNLLLTIVAIRAEHEGSVAQMPGSAPVQAIWESSLKVVELIVAEKDVLPARGQEMRLEVLEMALGCIWGAIKLDSAALAISDTTIAQLLLLPSILQTDLARTRIIEILALLASRSTVTVSQNETISRAILSSFTTSPAPSAEIMIALVNAVIDIYADEAREYDSVFRQGGYVNTLQSAVGPLKAAVRGIDKRTERQARTRGEEAVENLEGFIAYRRGL